MSAAKHSEDRGEPMLPCNSCNLLERLDAQDSVLVELKGWHQEIRDSQRRMERALMGDEEIGHKGIVHRLDRVEKQSDKLMQKFILFTGVAVGLAHAKDKLLEFLK
jgi:hypothetical protein